MWSARASACRHNAAAMSTVDTTLQLRQRAQLPEIHAHDSHSESRGMPPSPSPIPLSGRVGCHGTVRVVQQLWSLLASSIEVMVSTKRNSCILDRDRKSVKDAVTSSSSQPGSSSAAVSGVLSMYDSMPLGDGSAVDWSISVLGRSMICRCINLLKKSGDLQTLATVVCIFGGSDKLVALMAPGALLRLTGIMMISLPSLYLIVHNGFMNPSPFPSLRFAFFL